MMVQYVFVRSDLPVGVLAAMVVHAAGEAAAYYERNYEPFVGATAVVLEAKNEDHLKEIKVFLDRSGVDYCSVHESDGVFAGQFMAMGVLPGSRESLAEVMRGFSILRDCKRLDNEVSAA